MPLNGLHILIIEIESMGAMDLAKMIHDAGARVVGPVSSASKALQLMSEETISAVIVSVDLDESLDIALRLKRLHIPFVYHTGHFGSCRLAAWPEAPVVYKSACEATLMGLLEEAINLEAMTPFSKVLN